MAFVTVEVSSVASPDNWTLAAGASKVAAVSLPDDDASTYINSGGTTNTVQTFTLSPPLSPGDIITAITLVARISRPSSNVNHVIGYSFTPQGGGVQAGESGTLVAFAGWNNETYNHSGLSVAWGSGMTIYIKNTQNRDMWLSTFSALITYTPGANGQPARTMHQFRLRRS